MTYTLITGASGYIGAAFAKLCAERGENLLLAGRNTQKLNAVAESVAKLSGSLPVVVPCDLTDFSQREDMFEKLANFKISRLISVAGADTQMPFSEYSDEKIAFQIRINFEAAAVCAAFAVRNRAERLSIINISSVCGLSPMPNFAIYSAAKGALTSLSVALNEEFRGKGVTVTAVLPGSVYTRPDVCEYIEGLGAWGRFAAKSPEFVAKKALGAADKRKAKVVVGGANKFVAFAMRFIPQRIRLRFIASKWGASRKDAF